MEACTEQKIVEYEEYAKSVEEEDMLRRPKIEISLRTSFYVVKSTNG